MIQKSATKAKKSAKQLPAGAGFTTGTCAQAAAKAAAIMLTTGMKLRHVAIMTPTGIKLDLPLIDQKIGRGFARCGIVKDAGDDHDITDRAKIYAEVKFSERDGVAIRGRTGVGLVTKPGLAVAVGESAINPTPRRMITREVSPYVPQDKGLEVIIDVPGGEALAERTFNPRLGIVGGISIIGTTGIVEPKSANAYKASLSLELDVIKAAGRRKTALVLGYVGEKFCKETLHVDPDGIVKIGDHVGFILTECVKKGIQEVILIGHIGKLIKVANGQFNTHIKFGDKRIETIARYAENSGAKRKVIDELLEQTTAEATIDIIRKNNVTRIFPLIAEDVVAVLNGFTRNKLSITCILLSLIPEVLAVHPENRI